ncbi:MAG TPA: leucine-rich repeat domain-containing protein [Candidatus Saccharimonadales bacterium]|nr:leucine-rich repeat domain-containing protein [Candidatus Saccharimonadales bacterium]
MKSAIIILLVLAVGILGYLQFIKKDSPNTNNSGSQTTSTQKPEATSGKTIDLSNRGLSEFPKDILNNSSVTTLDVSGNNLTGALPAEIRMLTNLEVLDASDNKMTGIPAEIGQLSKLRVANFANNDISGLPLEIGNLKNLQTLDLRGNPNVSKYDISKIQPKIPNAEILTD